MTELAKYLPPPVPSLKDRRWFATIVGLTGVAAISCLVGLLFIHANPHTDSARSVYIITGSITIACVAYLFLIGTFWLLSHARRSESLYHREVLREIADLEHEKMVLYEQLLTSGLGEDDSE